MKLMVRYQDGTEEYAGDGCDVCWTDEQLLDHGATVPCGCGQQCGIHWCSGVHGRHVLRRLHLAGDVSQHQLSGDYQDVRELVKSEQQLYRQAMAEFRAQGRPEASGRKFRELWLTGNAPDWAYGQEKPDSRQAQMEL